MNGSELSMWMQTAKPRESCVYFSGCMVLDDDGNPRAKPPVAEIAWRLAISGAAALTQRRTGKVVELGGRRMGVNDYIITLGAFTPLYPSFPYLDGDVDRDGRIRPSASKP
jgi:hypothetical protein